MAPSVKMDAECARAAGEITVNALSNSGARSRNTTATISAFVAFDKPARRRSTTP